MAMERTRIAKVDEVKLVRRGEQVEGTLHLTPHHLIFCHTPSTTPENPKPKTRELWITYPIIHKCSLRSSHPASHHPSSLRLQCRDFTFICFCFDDERKARDVYDSIRAWTCKIGRIEKLYAFSYQPQKPEKDMNGWTVYDAKAEFRRQGISGKVAEKGWRISSINSQYTFSPTYPAVLAVPSAISDNTLNYAVKYRSRGRLPVLTYLHPVNNCSITRCAQPMVGVRQNRSVQDEKLLMTIFNTSTSGPVETEPPSRPRSGQSNRSGEGDIPVDPPPSDAEALEDEVIAATGVDREDDDAKVYGAQQNNLIVDARPTVNAYAMQAVGLGSENMDNYRFAKKVYLGIDNIHVMRDSLNKVIETLKDSDVTPLAPNREDLAKSKWLKHIACLLDGTGIIVRQVGLQHSHVLIHCSDGWDRTSQLSALSQLCLDPYYRTLGGFITLVEKDWLSFGHQFAHRTGFLSSEKWFNIENERITAEHSTSTPSNTINGKASSLIPQNSGAGAALETALMNAKSFFNKDNTSRDSLPRSDDELQAFDSATGSPRKSSSSLFRPQNGHPTGNGSTPASKDDPAKSTTKVKETSPIFHQFLDATYQLLTQHPTRFEFNERFLRRLLYHVYSCQYGTFLYNNERERVEAKVSTRTRSVWEYFLARRELWMNPRYEAEVDDHVRGKERLILPERGGVRWWSEVFGRTDEEMNGGIGLGAGLGRRPLAGVGAAGGPVTATGGGIAEGASVLRGVETAQHGTGPAAAPGKDLLNGEGADKVASKLEGLDIQDPDRGLGASAGGPGTEAVVEVRDAIKTEMQ